MPVIEPFRTSLIPQGEVLTKKGFPYSWCAHPHDEKFFIFERAIIHEVTNLLKKDDLPDFCPHMFDSSDALEQTVYAIAGEGNIKKIRGTHLNLGKKALILLHEVEVDWKPHHFVTYLSRGAEGTVLGDEAVADYRNLTYLSQQFRARLSPEASKKHRVIQPIAYGLSSEYRGEKYPFFTMPVVNDADEIKYNIHPYLVNGQMFGAPSIIYAYPFDRKTREVNENQYRQGLSLATKIKKLTRQRGFDEAIRIAENTEAGILYKTMSTEILTQLSLIYLLSQNRFPREFLVSAGDIMAKIAKHSLENITSITIRGGFGGELTEQTFITRLREQEEPFYPVAGDMIPQLLPVFSGVGEEKFHEVINTAKSMIIK